MALTQPVVMGIINTTHNSFYAGSRALHVQDVVERAGMMQQQGAFCVDLGGQSTRPGAEPVSADDEAALVVPAIEAVAKALPGLIISVDTFYPTVAQSAVAAGAHLVNDVSGGAVEMLQTVASLGVPYVCMHSRGNARTMQQLTHYDDLVEDLLNWFTQKLHECKTAGINDVIIDPGFGFAKTPAQNFLLLQQLKQFQLFNCPIMVGLSRKSTIYKTLDVTAEEALNGTTVAHTIALMHGAQILRVHDVAEAVQAIKLVEAMRLA